MEHTPAGTPIPAPAAPTPRVDVVIPAFNEAASLAASIRHLRAYLNSAFPFPSVITIVDNASTDATLAIALELVASMPGVRVRHLDAKGRGRALRAAWLASEADVVAYMDVDLSTGLDALLPLVAPLVSGHSDIAIGSRLANGARVVRGPKRELISRSYNHILRATLHSRVTDAQCGFKAMRSEIAGQLLPLVEDTGWFFDTEVLALAERNGLRIHEVAVDWVDDPDSRVDVVTTSLGDLKGIWRLRREFAGGGGRLVAAPRGRVAQGRAVGGGAAVGAAWLVWFLALRPGLGILGGDLAGLLAAGAMLAAARLTGGQDRPGARRPGGWAVGAAAAAALLAGLASANLWVQLGAASLAWGLAGMTAVVTSRSPRAQRAAAPPSPPAPVRAPLRGSGPATVRVPAQGA